MEAIKSEQPQPSTRTCWPSDITLLLSRLPLGLLFLFAGLDKMRMGVGTFYAKEFVALKPAWLPDAFARPYGHLLPFAEFAVGALLVVGLAGRVTAGLMFVMLASFTIALGAAGMLFSGPAPVHSNFAYAGLALLLAATGPGRLSVDGLLRYKRRRGCGS